MLTLLALKLVPQALQCAQVSEIFGNSILGGLGGLPQIPLRKILISAAAACLQRFCAVNVPEGSQDLVAAKNFEPFRALRAPTRISSTRPNFEHPACPRRPGHERNFEHPPNFWEAKAGSNQQKSPISDLVSSTFRAHFEHFEPGSPRGPGSPIRPREQQATKNRFHAKVHGLNSVLGLSFPSHEKKVLHIT